MRTGLRSEVGGSLRPPAAAGGWADPVGAIGATPRFPARRTAALSLLFAGAAGFLTYAALAVPVQNLVEPPGLTERGVTMHWPVAAIGLAIVLTVDAAVVAFVLRKRRRASPAPAVTTRSPEAEPYARPRPNGHGAAGPSGIPASLRFQGIPRWALGWAVLASGGMLAATTALDLLLWKRALGVLCVWAPVLVLEGKWKFRRYGAFALFLGLAVLQVGHLGEHATQVLQLLVSGGDLDRSHGVFGRLDFETVHFTWDTAIWLGGGLLVYAFWHNPWLWVSWAVASVHQIEHIYLFWVNRFDLEFYSRGGISGIMGEGGLVGSPLSRPYLHFTYNFLVVVPMLIGLWDEARRVRERAQPSSLTV